MRLTGVLFVLQLILTGVSGNGSISSLSGLPIR
jgi:hypothetical protein